MTEAIERLYAKVVSSRDGDPTKSYTASLFQRGRHRIAQKLGEEAIETVLAAVEEDRQPHGGMYDGRGAPEMILAVYESHRVGAVADLPLRERRHPLALP